MCERCVSYRGSYQGGVVKYRMRLSRYMFGFYLLFKEMWIKVRINLNYMFWFYCLCLR